jgi:HEAT repeat protein
MTGFCKKRPGCAAAKRRSAQRLYQRYEHQVPTLIRQLGTNQAAHDRAFGLLSKMGETIVTELLEALADPTLDPIAADEVVSLLGAAGDQRARAALWAFFEANRDDPERASTAALSLSGLGDERVLPYVRTSLQARDEELVSSAVASMISLGEMEDVDRLRLVHLRFLANREIRVGVASAILTILSEAMPSRNKVVTTLYLMSLSMTMADESLSPQWRRFVERTEKSRLLQRFTRTAGLSTGS